jgi:hypothetical protein
MCIPQRVLTCTHGGGALEAAGYEGSLLNNETCMHEHTTIHRSIHQKSTQYVEMIAANRTHSTATYHEAFLIGPASCQGGGRRGGGRGGHLRPPLASLRPPPQPRERVHQRHDFGC